MGLRAALLVASLAGALQACWADFPDSRLNRDGSDKDQYTAWTDGPVFTDGPVSIDGPISTDGPQADQAVSDAQQPDGLALDANPPLDQGSVSCASDADCGGYDCNKGTCRTSCFQNNHCAQDYLCKVPTHECVQLTSCTKDSQCDGYDCSQGTCRVYCTGDWHCASGYHCDKGQCVQ